MVCACGQVRLVMHDAKKETTCADFVLTSKSKLSAQALDNIVMHWYSVRI